MKKLILILSVVLISSATYCQESGALGTSGDNLDLYAVMELFKESESVEDFENKLNSEKNDVNNLDLNEDGFVDYIRVIDYADGKTHSLTLQVPYSDAEAQDVAVIEIENTADDETVAQIVGDEDLYGKDYIVEPGTEDSKTVTNVHQWKPVRHIYGPKYVIWISPWKFGHYPKHYRPWKPVLWTAYHARVKHHHHNHRRSHVYRSHHAHAHYHKHRAHSHTYHAKHHKGGAKASKPKSKSAQPTKRAKKSSAPQKAKSSPAPQQTKGKPTKRPGAVKSTKSKTKKKSGTTKKKGKGR
jgi:hypothetical protein